jgi:hypothetical protein
MPGVYVTNFPSNIRITDMPGITGTVVLDAGTNLIGNVKITQMPGITGNVWVNGVTGNISGITTLPAITGNVGVSGNVSITQLPALGNVSITQMPGITGNVDITRMPGVTGNVHVYGNVNVDNFPSNVRITDMPGITGNVHIYGNIGGSDQPVTVNQGTSPWVTTATITGGNVNITPDYTSGDFYGEPYAISITPVVQTYGTYGINTREHQTYTGSGGNVTTANSTFVVSSTSTVGSYGVIRSRRFNTFKPGQSLLARTYSKFSTPAAGTSQRVGIQNQQDSYYIGYTGTQFGVVHTHGGRVPLYRVTVNSYTGSQTVTVTLNGVAYTASIVTGETTGQAAERIAITLRTSAAASWLVESVDNYITFLYTGTLAPLGGTFSVTGSGTFSGSMTTIQAGVAATNDWYYAGTDFVLPGTIDPTGYQQWQIKYSWAGATFFYLDQTTGRYVKFYNHYHLGANDSNLPQVINPAYKVAALAYNIGGSTPVSVYVADMMLGLEGVTNRNNFPGGAAINQTSLTQNDTHHIISISNPLVFNGVINTREILMQDLTVTMQCNDPTLMYLYLDAPLSTGVHDFQSQDGFAVSVSTVTGLIDPTTNFPILSFVVGLTGSTTQFALESYRLVLPPGSTMSIAVTSTAVIQKAAAAISWYND